MALAAAAYLSSPAPSTMPPGWAARLVAGLSAGARCRAILLGRLADPAGDPAGRTADRRPRGLAAALAGSTLPSPPAFCRRSAGLRRPVSTPASAALILRSGACWSSGWPGVRRPRPPRPSPRSLSRLRRSVDRRRGRTPRCGADLARRPRNGHRGVARRADRHRASARRGDRAAASSTRPCRRPRGVPAGAGGCKAHGAGRTAAARLRRGDGTWLIRQACVFAAAPRPAPCTSPSRSRRHAAAGSAEPADGARRGQSIVGRQEPVPGGGQPRIAHAAQRDHRVLGHPRPGILRRLRERSPEGICRADPAVRPAPPVGGQQPARRFQDRGRPLRAGA